MKLYFFTVGVATLLAMLSPEAIVLPAAQAAVFISPSTASALGGCETASCRAGWQLAIEKAVEDEGQCPSLSQARDEIDGCRKFVHAGEQDHIVSAW